MINDSEAAAAPWRMGQYKEAQKKRKRKKKRVVLAGSSSIEYWKKAPLAFYPMKTVNIGIAGTTAEEWQRMYSWRIPQYRPDAVVLYVGGNDIMRKKRAGSGAETAGFICRILTRLRASLPGVPVYYVSIAPSPQIWKEWDQAKRCNGLVSQFCSRYKDLHYIDLAKHCLNRRGRIKKGLFRPDRLHFNKKGYKLWNKFVAQRVKNDLRAD